MSNQFEKYVYRDDCAGEGLGDGNGLVDGTSSVSGQTRDQFHVVTYRRPFRFLALAGVVNNRRMKQLPSTAVSGDP